MYLRNYGNLPRIQDTPVTRKFIEHLNKQSSNIAQRVWGNLVRNQVLSEIVIDENAKTYYMRQHVMTRNGDYIRKYSQDYVQRYMRRQGYTLKGSELDE